MASKEGMIFKFFEKWKQKKLNKFAKNMLKDNPSLEKNLRIMDKSMEKVIKDFANVIKIIKDQYNFINTINLSI